MWHIVKTYPLFFFFSSHTQNAKEARGQLLYREHSDSQKKKKKISSLDAVLVKNHFQIIAYRSSIFFIFNSLIIRLLKKKKNYISFSTIYIWFLFSFYFYFQIKVRDWKIIHFKRWSIFIFDCVYVYYMCPLSQFFIESVKYGFKNSQNSIWEEFIVLREVPTTT